MGSAEVKLLAVVKGCRPVVTAGCCPPTCAVESEPALALELGRQTVEGARPCAQSRRGELGTLELGELLCDEFPNFAQTDTHTEVGNWLLEVTEGKNRGLALECPRSSR